MEPDQPVILENLVKRLGSHRIVEELDAHLHDTTVLDHGLEVLLGQWQGAAHRHTAVLTVDHGLHHSAFEHEVTVHQDDVIVLQQLLGTIDAVDVVGLGVERVVDKGDLQGKVEGITVIFQYLVVITCGHHHLFHAEGSKHTQLSAQNSVLERYFGHTFRMLIGDNTHAGP